MNAFHWPRVLMLILLLGAASPAVAAEEQPAAGEPKPTLAEPRPAAKAEPVAGAQPVARAEPVAEAGLKPIPATEPLSVTVQLVFGNTELRGTLLSSTDLAMKTSFGDVTIPLSEVAGVKLASQGNASTTVVMHNGDSITGAWDLERLEVQTEWGLAIIDGTAVNSILFAQGMAWVSEQGLSGTRWALMERPGSGAESSEPASTEPQVFKPGDIIVVSDDLQMQVGEEYIGAVSKGEVLAVKKVQDSWVMVNNGSQEGWIPSNRVSLYKEPSSEGTPTETARNPRR